MKLKGINIITNMSYMLQGCESFRNIFEISNWNTVNYC